MIESSQKYPELNTQLSVKHCYNLHVHLKAFLAEKSQNVDDTEFDRYVFK